jgi:hypothetical protein
MKSEAMKRSLSFFETEEKKNRSLASGRLRLRWFTEKRSGIVNFFFVVSRDFRVMGEFKEACRLTFSAHSHFEALSETTRR